MDRRDFLKILGGTALIPVIPALASTPDNADLKAWFEKNFKCKIGEPRAGTDYNGKIYFYYTYAAGILNGTPEEAKKQLTQHFIDQFSTYSKGKPELIWRTEPQFVSEEVITYGDTWMTAEQIEDGTFDGKLHRYVTNGMSKRGLMEEVTVPANVELDFNTGNYRHVQSKDTLHKMRFRLTIPKFQKQLEPFAKVAGDNIARI